MPTPEQLAAFANPELGTAAEPWADEMMSFFEKIIEKHPDLNIDDILLRLGDAFEEMDEPASKAALDELVAALSKLNPKPAYPKLSKAERTEAGRKIGQNIREGKYKSRAQAIAVGLRQAAPGKYKRFAKAQR